MDDEDEIPWGDGEENQSQYRIQSRSLGQRGKRKRRRERSERRTKRGWRLVEFCLVSERRVGVFLWEGRAGMVIDRVTRGKTTRQM